MKYMGSKRSMLRNGLGETISREMKGRTRFADLFTGSGAVAWHVARGFDAEVVASDLQQFAVDLAASVVCRSEPSETNWIDAWMARADRKMGAHKHFKRAHSLQEKLGTAAISSLSRECRELCAGGGGAMFAAYGGYYFSPLQALRLDLLRQTLPANTDHAAIALAALIQSASRCSASPGHTAQPFKANLTAGRFVEEAWSRDIARYVRSAAETLARDHARVAGKVVRANAARVAVSLRDGDLAFVDPPYSGVHYSRFYHVLETLARGKAVEVSGTGRYPPSNARPQSDYSIATRSEEALEDLLEALANVGCAVIVTFPAGEASNGLSGDDVYDIAEQFFKIRSAKVTSRFSTLGGNLSNREARQDADELILTLYP